MKSNLLHSEIYVEQKRMKQKNIRCNRCWMDIRERCICAMLPSISLNPRIEIVVYMHFHEYLNPGDDAKLLLATLPNQSKLVLFPFQNNELVEYLANKSGRMLVLFPSSSAISSDRFLEELDVINQENLTIIVIDAVWKNARKMAATLKEIIPTVPHVQLSPTVLSVYARTQSQLDRICTVEATSLFLSLLGENSTDCEKLITCVKINNQNLKRKPLT